MADHPNLRDPFREVRNKDGVLQCPFQGETFPMILRHADVREAAKDWKTYSSDAPFRVVGIINAPKANWKDGSFFSGQPEQFFA
jgi:hypothetical protein